jgi:1-acyl-sn-glycerol-3-phosphate acyltransferase
VVLHILLALLIVALLFPFWSVARRQRLIRWWSRHVLGIFGIRVRVTGPMRDGEIIDRVLRPGGIGAMLVMNHISWLDVYVVHTLRPARFVAKAEISRWPLLGYLTDRTGAIFIERGKRHAVREVNHRAAAMMRDGDLMGMFPEGTTSDGFRLLPFHANLIQPAIDAGAPIVVAGLRYREVDGRATTATSYVGDTTLLQSILRIARHGPLVAELHLIEAIDGSHTTRHDVARTARVLIAEALGFDDEAHETAESLSTVIVAPDDGAVSPDGALAGRRPGTALDPRDELL